MMRAILQRGSTSVGQLGVVLLLSSCRVYDAALVDELHPAPGGLDAAVSADCCSGALSAADGGDVSERCQRGDTSCPRGPSQPSQPSAAGSGADAGAGRVDLCPHNPEKTTPGICGCHAPETDRDRDGTVDCIDGCPDDRRKTVPGVCGCGAREVDSDDDGSPDCVDACPQDAAKTLRGACGCGRSDADRDEDTVPDCMDRCPSDPNKTAPGECGCGVAEPVDPNQIDVQCNKAALVHRYSFDGEGPRLVDRVADDDAWVPDGARAMQAAGRLTLSGNIEDGYDGEGYAQLPAAALRDLRNATIEVWFIWLGAGPRGGTEWQRIFHFGTPEGNGRPHSYLYLTPRGDGGLQVAFSLDHRGRGTAVITTPDQAERDVVQHVAVVIDRDARTLALYRNGQPAGTTPLDHSLADLAPQNLWLGRSTFEHDPELHGSLLEFRIYRQALTAAQLRASAEAGPDYTFQ